jgi:hypothetical protein
MEYSFLQKMTLIDTGRVRQPKERNPKGMAVRVFANGEVYPSQELVEKYKLEFRNKGGIKEANGIDVVDSIEWKPLADQPRMILFGFTDKKHPKVDLFASCKYNDDDTPKGKVMEQGPVSEDLLELVRSMGYLNNDQKYVDLVILEQYPINTADGLAFIPKVITRGANKGEKTYERRENVTFFPVTTAEEFEKMNTAKAAEEPAQTPVNTETV